ncbi:MAG: hypothetical protein LBT05_11050 [Planctomycetaceae bacterium]|jgi:hypothetical protein|nr:hypothetical protein [Planctomycetaceae bacterium]
MEQLILKRAIRQIAAPNITWCINNAFDTGNRSLLRSGSNNIFRGERQFDRLQTYNSFNTIMPPNGPACAQSDAEDRWGVYSPQSWHSGGKIYSYVSSAFGDEDNPPYSITVTKKGAAETFDASKPVRIFLRNND